ncbi:MAG: hypothetical protein M3Y72_24495 [Acidobacteriota bacterium]|nr:hypothetical protein [Acidobacteriota bacterium]
MYTQVNLIQSTDTPPILIPGEAIVVRNGENMVALIENQIVHMRAITIGRDYGDETEITHGLKPGEVVALNISDEVHEGAKVQPQFTKERQMRGGQSDKNPSVEGRYGNENLSNQGSSQGSGQKKQPPAQNKR